MTTYNRDAAVGYAVQFTDIYKGYGKYNQDGFDYIPTESGNSGRGDCANFVSQCLWAGGMPMTDEWHNNTPYINPNTGPTTWNGTNSLRQFLLRNNWAEQVTSKHSLKKGDIVYTVKNGQYTHVVIVSRDVGSDGAIYVCGHTANQRDKKRTTPSGSTDYYLHIKDTFINANSNGLYRGYSSQQDFETAMANYGPDTLHPGETSSYIANMQRRLNYLGYYYGAFDGVFNDATTAAVESFQADKGLGVDGLPGWKTKNALYHPRNYD